MLSEPRRLVAYIIREENLEIFFRQDTNNIYNATVRIG